MAGNTCKSAEECYNMIQEDFLEKRQDKVG